MCKKKNTILIVDAHGQTCKLLEVVLEDRDFRIVACACVKRAVGLCVSVKPDMVLLDFDVPGVRQTTLIRAIREWSQIPIIVISVRNGDADIVDMLMAGADDYVVKPYSVEVLRARIIAALRKAAVAETGEPELSNGPLRMDLVRHEVFVDGKPVALTPKEYALFRYFMANCGKMLGHREILNEVWGAAHVDNTQYLRVFVGQIRVKIEKDPAHPQIIKTEPGVGYRMEALPDGQAPHQQEMPF